MKAMMDTTKDAVMDWLHTTADKFGSLSTRSQALVVVGLIIVAHAIVVNFRSWYRLRHIPGPFFNSITSLALFFHFSKGTSTQYLQGLAKKYGTYRITALW